MTSDGSYVVYRMSYVGIEVSVYSFDPAIGSRIENHNGRQATIDGSRVTSDGLTDKITMTVWYWILGVSAGLVIYCYFVFPVLLFLLARLFPRPVKKAPVTPSVTILIPAYNEARVIREKIENSLSLDYPPGKLDIIVVSDGSTDSTPDIVREYGARGVRLVHYPERRGKVPAILDAVGHVESDLIVFSDASGMLRPGSLRAMVSNFADPSVGCVCGYYRSPGLAGRGGHGELIYWDYEFAIKRAESIWGTLLGATGAMYAVRRDLFEPPRRDIINDDFVIPALVVLKGYRMVLEEGAVVDDYDPHFGNFRSRVRVAVGNWQQLFYLRGLLSPLRPVVCWEFVSHKLIRMLVPLLLVACAVSLIALWPPAAPLLALALVVALVSGGRSGSKLCAAARKFVAGNAAGLYGTFVFFFRRGRLQWS